MKSIKITAVFQKLDYTGKVLTKKLNTVLNDIIDVKKFIKTTIETSNYNKLPKLYHGCYTDFMKKYFKMNSDAAFKAVSVESESIGGLKYVFYRRKDQIALMKWVDEDE